MRFMLTSISFVMCVAIVIMFLYPEALIRFLDIQLRMLRE